MIVLGATNRADMLDPALLRPGRFDLTIELPLPDFATRAAIAEVHLRDRPLDDDIDYRIVARETDGWSGADIAGLCRQAAMLAIREAVAAEATGEVNLQNLCISLRHLAEAYSQLGYGTLDPQPLEDGGKPKRRGWWG